MELNIERLISIRENLGISRAEAARRLKMTPMAYGRYERGERTPSFQTVSHIATVFNTSTDYLYGLCDEPSSDTITISAKDDPELFAIVSACKSNDDMAHRLTEYFKKYMNL